MTTYDEMISRDLELLYSIQDFCRERPWLDNRISWVVSKYPWQDIVVVLWVLFIVGVIEIGNSHFWIVCLNLGAAFVTRKLVQAKRPVEFDSRLYPLTDIGAESYGFPSLESYMAVVIVGHFILSLKSLLFIPIGFILVFCIGFSRVYSRSRFPHQVVGSWLLGVVGLLLGIFAYEKIDFPSMTHHGYGIWVGFVVVAAVANFALSAENNDSRLMYVPKGQFLNVIAGIVNQSSDAAKSQAAQGDGAYGTDERAQLRVDKDIYRFADSPRSMAARLAQQSEKLRRRNGKVINRDSFYFLQKTLEHREEERKSLLVSKEEAASLPLFHSGSKSKPSRASEARVSNGTMATAIGSGGSGGKTNTKKKNRMPKYDEEAGQVPASAASASSRSHKYAVIIGRNYKEGEEEEEEEDYEGGRRRGGGGGGRLIDDDGGGGSSGGSPPVYASTSSTRSRRSVGRSRSKEADSAPVFSPRSAALRKYRNQDYLRSEQDQGNYDDDGEDDDGDEDDDEEDDLPIAERVLRREIRRLTAVIGDHRSTSGTGSNRYSGDRVNEAKTTKSNGINDDSEFSPRKRAFQQFRAVDYDDEEFVASDLLDIAAAGGGRELG